MDISPRLIRAKRPCADGYRWYVRSGQSEASYLQLMQALVAAGRASDAAWLLAQFGATDDVLELDELGDEALVFPGTVRVRGNVDVSGAICVGQALVAGGGVRAGGDIHVGDELACEGAVHASGAVRCASLKVGMSFTAASLDCAGAVRIGSWVELLGHLAAGDQAVIGGTLRTEAAVDCTRGLFLGDDAAVGHSLRVGRGVLARGSLSCADALTVGWGVRAGGDVTSGGSIQVGESLLAGGEVRAGAGYGVYAGLCAREIDWEHSGRVSCPTRPEALMSGVWAPLHHAG